MGESPAQHPSTIALSKRRLIACQVENKEEEHLTVVGYAS